MKIRTWAVTSTIILVAIILVFSPNNFLNNAENQLDLKPIEFSSPLDLTDDQATKNTIIHYVVNRDNKPEEPIKIIPMEKIGEYYNITIHLEAVRNTSILFPNNTLTAQKRWFDVNYIDYSQPLQEKNITGWIDMDGKIREWDVYSIEWINSTRSNSGPHIWIPNNLFNMDLLYTVNYTGLPEGEDVKVYPVSHILDDESFTIVFENNRDSELYWGSSWSVEEYVNGEWVKDNSSRVWTMELRSVDSFGKATNGHKFPFDTGLYRISKRCMLTDDYDRDKREWADEFTASFYLIKMSD